MIKQLHDGIVQLVLRKRLLQEDIGAVEKCDVLCRSIITGDHNNFNRRIVAFYVVDEVNSKPVGEFIIENDDRGLLFL